VINNTLFNAQSVAAVLKLHDNAHAESDDIVAIFDRYLRYVHLNEAGCKQLNTNADDLLGRNIVDMYPHIIASTNHRNLLKCLGGEEIRSVITGRDGELFSTVYLPIFMSRRVEGIYVRSRRSR